MVGLPGWRSRTRTAPCSPLWGGDAQMTWWAQKITICYDLPHYNISHSKIFQNLQNFKKFFAEFETHSVHLCPPPRFGGSLSWHPKAWADSVFKLSFKTHGVRTVQGQTWYFNMAPSSMQVQTLKTPGLIEALSTGAKHARNNALGHTHTQTGSFCLLDTSSN